MDAYISMNTSDVTQFGLLLSVWQSQKKRNLIPAARQPGSQAASRNNSPRETGSPSLVTASQHLQPMPCESRIIRCTTHFQPALSLLKTCKGSFCPLKSLLRTVWCSILLSTLMHIFSLLLLYLSSFSPFPWLDSWKFWCVFRIVPQDVVASTLNSASLLIVRYCCDLRQQLHYRWILIDSIKFSFI